MFGVLFTVLAIMTIIWRVFIFRVDYNSKVYKEFTVRGYNYYKKEYDSLYLCVVPVQISKSEYYRIRRKEVVDKKSLKKEKLDKDKELRNS